MDSPELARLNADLIAFSRRYGILSLASTIIGILLGITFSPFVMALFGLGLYGLLKSLLVPGHGRGLATRAAVQKRILKLALVTVAAFVVFTPGLMALSYFYNPDWPLGFMLLSPCYAALAIVALAVLYDRTMRRIPKPAPGEGAAGSPPSNGMR